MQQLLSMTRVHIPEGPSTYVRIHSPEAVRGPSECQLSAQPNAYCDLGAPA